MWASQSPNRLMRKNKSARGGRLDSVTACISTTMVLILVGTVLFFAAVADNLSRSLRENFTVEVLLNDSIDQHQAYQLQTWLKSQPYTRQVVYTSKAEAKRSAWTMIFWAAVRFPLRSRYTSKPTMLTPIRSGATCRASSKTRV